MTRHGRPALAVAAFVCVLAAPLAAQLAPRATRPQVKPPQGPVRQVIFRYCTSCHGLDDYAYVDFDIEGMAAEAARAFVRDGHRRLAIAVSENPLNYQEIAFSSLAAEAVRLGLPPGSVRMIRMREGRLSEADRDRIA